MSRFGFTNTRAIGGALSASDRRFKMSQLEIQRRQSESEIKGMKDLTEWAVEEQKRLADLQLETTKSLEDAIRLQTEAQEDFATFAEGELAKQTKQLETNAGDVTALADNLRTEIQGVNRRLDLILGISQNGSAGGFVGRTTATGAYVTGVVSSTGEVRLWHRHVTTNAAGTLELRLPAGWLLCDGTSFAQEQYPELAAVLGATYLGSNSPGYWLPAKADLTEDAVVLANTALDYLIRT